MTDLEAKLERFETLAAECELIGKLTADGAKRELYLRLGLHYRELADDIRTVIARTPLSRPEGAGSRILALGQPPR
ncbi:hypothetical protein [Bradyrhizobium australiense]|uniref:Uncharacterized protein n=1 Tax=Bradyrhizobium australiense TaxID=2721161 RepID=A0A7Y4GVD9_9BRAD|nr:hypothetical protein [Bradyrhizobium australiense]NOJ42308.1 hypothetical protein [Bradyrhizobium australiense]